MTRHASNIRIALVPVAGKGTRLKPISSVVPKAMLPLVDNQDNILSVLHVILRQVRLAGIERAGIIISPWQEAMLKQYFTAVRDQGGEDLPRAIEYITQAAPAGFGHAVLSAVDFVGDQPFLLMLGDHIHIPDRQAPGCVEQVVRAFASQPGSAMVGVQPVPEDELCRVGVAGGAPLGQNIYRCRQFVEKPAVSLARARLVTEGLLPGTFLGHCGIYVFSPEIFACLRQVESAAKEANAEIELAAAQSLLLDRYPEQYLLCRIEGHAYDVGTPKGYAEAQVAFRKQACSA